MERELVAVNDTDHVVIEPPDVNDLIYVTVVSFDGNGLQQGVRPLGFPTAAWMRIANTILDMAGREMPDE
jgi:hypothetical protein